MKKFLTKPFTNLILMLILSILVFGCKSSFRNNMDREYVNGNIKIIADDGNIKAIPGEIQNNDIDYEFSKIGQSYTFKKNDKINLKINGLDFSRTTFLFEFSDDDKYVTMKSVEIEHSKIYLSRKCEKFLWNEPDYLPVIELLPSLDPEQIIITPIFDDQCFKIGYQIRYGSSERGCRKESIDVLKHFKKCAKPLPRKKRHIPSDLFE